MLYTRDVSGYENNQNYRQLDSMIFIYDFITGTAADISTQSIKPSGMNDLDPIFSPNHAEILFMSNSNDNISARNIIKIYQNATGDYVRAKLFTNAEMPDWE